MTIDHGLHVEVQDDKILVTLPHTGFAATYDRLANDPHLYAKNFPLEGDPRSEMSQAEFMAHAWRRENWGGLLSEKSLIRRHNSGCIGVPGLRRLGQHLG
jgi:hypothetical protein